MVGTYIYYCLLITFFSFILSLFVLFFTRKKVIILSLFSIFLLMFGYMLYKPLIVRNIERMYCGKVVNVYMTPAGYKVYPEKRVVFYNKDLGRNIDVRVDFQTYSNSKVGDNICFTLNEYQINE